LDIEVMRENQTMAETQDEYVPRLKKQYQDEVVPALVKQFNYKNVMQAPRIEKVIVNMGVGQAGQTGGDPKLLDNAIPI